MAKIPCESCGEPVQGEHGFSDCGCGELDCECERFAPGEWYYDDERYTCASCDAVHKASVDDETASLDLVLSNGVCECGGEIGRSADGLWYDEMNYRCPACGATYRANVYGEDECDLTLIQEQTEVPRG